MSELSDGELIQHFCSRGDQAAFAELIARHSAMVLAAARSVVGETSAAEDIAQATFVTFAKKVGSLEGERSCAGWLHHVAVCLARNARRDELRRAAREKEAAMIEVEPDTSPSFSQALLGALHEELAGLSETYRVPVILHHIEGLSYEQAAAAIGCNVMTFGSNLTRAREKLRKRLTKRGVTLGVTALVAGLGQSASAAELPAGFVASTCAAAKGGVVSAKVAALTDSALKMLFWAKVQTVAAICAVTVLVAGSGLGVAVTLPLVLKQEAATATKTEPLSPADAWITELLARAEAGPWDVLNLGTGVYSNDVWRMDARGGPAERRIWNMPVEASDARVASVVQLAEVRRPVRGVIACRIMLRPDGQPAPEVDGAQAVTNGAWRTSRLSPAAPVPSPWQNSRQGSLRLDYNLPGMVNYWVGDVPIADEHLIGVWHSFVVYVDRETPDGIRVVFSAWPDGSVPTSAAAWMAEVEKGPVADTVKIGLMAKGVLMEVQGLKFVPLGADMPLPPKELLERKQK